MGVSARLVSDLDPGTPGWCGLELNGTGPPYQPLPRELRLWGPLRLGVMGRFVVLTGYRGVRAGLIAVDPEDGSWRWLTPDDEASYRIEDDRPGRLRIRRTGLDGAESLWAWSGGGPPWLLRTLAWARPDLRVELRRWSVRDGALEGLLALPPYAAAPLPLVVELHGGPQPGLRAGDLDHAPDWVAAGFAHFRPEFRTSGILGRRPLRRQVRGLGRPDDDPEVEDVLASLHSLAGDPRLDLRRPLLIGFGYGGYLANRIAVRANPFAGIVCWEGAVNALRLRARRVRTPMLLAYGGQSNILEQGRDWYDGLCTAGAPATLLVSADQAHDYTPAAASRLVVQAAAWFRGVT